MLELWDEIAKSGLPKTEADIESGAPLYQLAQPFGLDSRPRLMGALVRDTTETKVVRYLCVRDGLEVMSHGPSFTLRPDQYVEVVFWTLHGNLTREVQMMSGHTFNIERSEAAKPRPYVLLTRHDVVKLGDQIRRDTVLCETDDYATWRNDWRERCTNWPPATELPITTARQWMDPFLPQIPKYRQRVISRLPAH